MLLNLGKYTHQGTWADVSAAIDIYSTNRSAQLRNRIALSIAPFIVKHCGLWHGSDELVFEEAFQDAFIYALHLIEQRHDQKFNDGRHFIRWLLASIKWRIRLHTKRQSRGFQTISFDADTSDINQFKIALHFCDRSIEDTRFEIEQWIEDLGEKYAPIVELVWLDGYSPRETAAKVGLKESEVNQRLKKARSVLGRKLLQRKAA